MQAKAFHLKIRKAKVNWDCSCCGPLGSKKKLVIKAKKREEKGIFSKLIQEELDDLLLMNDLH